MHLVKTLGLRILNLLIGAVGYLCFAGVVAVLGVQGLNSITHSERFGVMNVVGTTAKRFEKPTLDFLHAHVRCIYGNFDAAPVIIGLFLLLCCIACDQAAHRIRVYRLALNERRKLAERQEAINLQGEAYRLAAEAEKDPSKRQKLLEIYAKTKKILEDQKRTLAFLAIDVVNSTGMKQGEDPALAELDFRQYRKLVEAAIASHKGLKAAWTPDGVMICFASVEEAVQAGQELIRNLERFNREVKSMKAEFKVRCGVNAGEVLFDESVRMEEMSDKSIDLAGHMQKYAESNTIYIAQSLIESQLGHLGFRPANKKVDGCDVYAWRSDSAVDAGPGARA